MDLGELLKAYVDLPLREQAQFAAVVRAHQMFNSSDWKDELARRHGQIDLGREASIESVEQFVRALEMRNL
jgi:hypothetical protein